MPSEAHLPYELISLIITHIPLRHKSSLLTLSKRCLLWSQLAWHQDRFTSVEDDETWGHVQVTSTGDIVVNDRNQSRARRFCRLVRKCVEGKSVVAYLEHVRCLDVRWLKVGGGTDELCGAMFSSMPKLTNILGLSDIDHLRCFSGPSSLLRSLSMLVKSEHDLEGLSYLPCRRYQITLPIPRHISPTLSLRGLHRVIPILQLTALHSLHLEDCCDVSNDTLKKILTPLSHRLKSLTLKCTQALEESLTDFLAPKNTPLRILHLHTAVIDTLSEATFSNLGNLDVLDINATAFQVIPLCRYLRSGVTLRSITLTNLNTLEVSSTTFWMCRDLILRKRLNGLRWGFGVKELMGIGSLEMEVEEVREMRRDVEVFHF
ncbi:hypothetical protein BC829DRAFT_394900 [Chytridium lagenaria]|nr:hypothetical protein BC829DRAFT_394900 [Chytridium lagenaria]